FTNQWYVAISYDQGVQPKNNKGGNYNTPLDPSIVISNTITIQGSYPFFCTSTNTTSVDKMPLKLLNTSPYPDANGVQLAPEPDEIDKQKIDVPSILTVDKIQTYDTIIGWFYEGFSGDGLDMWTTSTIYHTIQGYSIPYTRYTYNGLQRAETKIRLYF
ncbi:MAG TPA: hypothetical protein PKV40_07910, partial [Candidatus Kapabacteria bacterium]|nr:hypothetical protein [Candidatus Kapabacteria bacterium]